MKPFNMKESNDDLVSALENNAASVPFSPDDVTDIVAEVCGANDELNWWWILKMKDGRFFLLDGSCDYTGWDCRSGVTPHGYFDTAEAAAQAAPEAEEYSKRSIRKNLAGQLDGTIPFAVYQS